MSFVVLTCMSWLTARLVTYPSREILIPIRARLRIDIINNLGTLV